MWRSPRLPVEVKSAGVGASSLESVQVAWSHCDWNKLPTAEFTASTATRVLTAGLAFHRCLQNV